MFLRGAIECYPVAFAVACGLGVALCGIFSSEHVYGTGYEQARAIIHSTDTIDYGFGPWKFLAILFSAISGIPGGIFAPVVWACRDSFAMPVPPHLACRRA